MQNGFSTSWICGVAVAALLTTSAVTSPNESRIQTLKRSTVLVCTSDDPVHKTGTGVVIRRSRGRDIAWVLTNSHIFSTPDDNTPKATATFYSGRKNETTVPVEVIAIDSEHDLAVLKAYVEGAPLPVSLKYEPGKHLKETQRLHVIGFPNRNTQNDQEKHTTPYIAPVTVSSLRRNELGKLAYIQVEGDVHDGNSGGAVVDDQERLVGISVRRMYGTNIAFVIPRWPILRIIKGHPGEVIFKTIANKDNRARLKVSGTMADPFKRIKHIDLLLIPTDEVKHVAQPVRKQWLPVGSTMQPFPLTISDHSLHGQIELASDGPGPIDYIYQLRFRYDDGVQHVTAPSEHTVHFDIRTQPPPTDDETWIGGHPKPKGEPHIVGEHVVARTSDVSGATVSWLSLDARALAPTMLVSRDRHAIYCAEPSGTLHKIFVPDCVKERQLFVGFPINSLTVCREGIVFSVPQKNTIWMVNEQSLEVIRKISGGHLMRLTSAPNATTVIGPNRGGRGMLVMSLTSEKVLGQFDANNIWDSQGHQVQRHESSQYLGRFQSLLVAEDGTHFLSVNLGCYHRFRLEDGTLTYQEISPQFKPLQPTFIDHQHRFVCGRVNNAPATSSGSETFLVYMYNNLQEPIVTVNSPDHDLLAIDSYSSRIFTANENSLRVFSNRGELEKTSL